MLWACQQQGPSSNNIDKIGNLAGMENLKILSLGRNLIKKPDNMDGLGSTLEQLWISYNLMSSLAGVEKLKVLKVKFWTDVRCGFPKLRNSHICIERFYIWIADVRSEFAIWIRDMLVGRDSSCCMCRFYMQAITSYRM